MAPIIARYKYTEAEAIRSMDRAVEGGAGSSRAASRWVGAIIFASATAYSVMKRGVVDGAAFCLLLGALLMAIPLWVRWQARRQFRSSPQRDTMVNWRFTATEMYSDGDGTILSIEWRMLYEVRECADGFLFFQQRALAYWAPHDSFETAEGVAALRQIIIASGVKRSGHGLGLGEKPMASPQLNRWAYRLLFFASGVMATGFFYQVDSWGSALIGCLMTPVLVGVVIAVMSIFASCRNSLVRAKVMIWGAVFALILSVSVFRVTPQRLKGGETTRRQSEGAAQDLRAP
ncbi:MAG: YcxB family protein [Verrucomicrobiota bacterium]